MSTITFQKEKHFEMWNEIADMIGEKIIETVVDTDYDSQMLLSDLKKDIIIKQRIKNILQSEEKIKSILTGEEYDIFCDRNKKFVSEITDRLSSDEYYSLYEIERKIRKSAEDSLPIGHCYACQYGYEKVLKENPTAKERDRCAYCPLDFEIKPCFGQDLTGKENGAYFNLNEAIANHDTLEARNFIFEILNTDIYTDVTVEISEQDSASESVVSETGSSETITSGSSESVISDSSTGSSVPPVYEIQYAEEFGQYLAIDSYARMESSTMFTGAVTQDQALKGFISALAEPRENHFVVDCPVWKKHGACNITKETIISGEYLIKYALNRINCDKTIEEIAEMCNVSDNYTVNVPETIITGTINFTMPTEKVVFRLENMSAYNYYKSYEMYAIEGYDDMTFLIPTETYSDSNKSKSYNLTEGQKRIYGALNSSVLKKCYDYVKEKTGLSFTQKTSTPYSTLSIPQESTYTSYHANVAIRDEEKKTTPKKIVAIIMFSDFYRWNKSLRYVDTMRIKRDHIALVEHYDNGTGYDPNFGIYLDHDFFSDVDSSGKLPNGEYLDYYFRKVLADLIPYAGIHNSPFRSHSGQFNVFTYRKSIASTSALTTYAKDLPKWMTYGISAIISGVNSDSLSRFRRDKRIFQRALKDEYTTIEDLYTAGYMILKTIAKYTASKSHTKKDIQYKEIQSFDRSPLIRNNIQKALNINRSINVEENLYGTIDPATGIISTNRLNTMLNTPVCTKRMTAAEVFYAFCQTMKSLRYNDILLSQESGLNSLNNLRRQRVVLNEMTISGKELIDFCIKCTTYGLSCGFTDYDTLISSFIEEITSRSDKTDETVLQEVCDIILDDKDAGSIVGYNANIEASIMSELDTVQESSDTAIVDHLPDIHVIKTINEDPVNGVSGFENTYRLYMSEPVDGVRLMIPQKTDKFNGTETTISDSVYNFLNLTATHIFKPATTLIKRAFGFSFD